MIDNGTELVIDEITTLRGKVKIALHKKYTKEQFYVHLEYSDAIKWSGYLLAMAGEVFYDIWK